MKEKRYTTLMLDLDLNQRLKAIAARRGVSMRSMVHQALEAICHDHGHPDPAMDSLAAIAGGARTGAREATKEAIEQYFKESMFKAREALVRDAQKNLYSDGTGSLGADWVENAVIIPLPLDADSKKLGGKK